MNRMPGLALLKKGWAESAGTQSPLHLHQRLKSLLGADSNTPGYHCCLSLISLLCYRQELLLPMRVLQFPKMAAILFFLSNTV